MHTKNASIEGGFIKILWYCIMKPGFQEQLTSFVQSHQCIWGKQITIELSKIRFLGREIGTKSLETLD